MRLMAFSLFIVLGFLSACASKKGSESREPRNPANSMNEFELGNEFKCSIAATSGKNSINRTFLIRPGQDQDFYDSQKNRIRVHLNRSESNLTLMTFSANTNYPELRATTDMYASQISVTANGTKYKSGSTEVTCSSDIWKISCPAHGEGYSVVNAPRTVRVSRGGDITPSRTYIGQAVRVLTNDLPWSEIKIEDSGITGWVASASLTPCPQK